MCFGNVFLVGAYSDAGFAYHRLSMFLWCALWQLMTAKLVVLSVFGIFVPSAV